MSTSQAPPCCLSRWAASRYPAWYWPRRWWCTARVATGARRTVRSGRPPATEPTWNRAGSRPAARGAVLTSHGGGAGIRAAGPAQRLRGQQGSARAARGGLGRPDRRQRAGTALSQCLRPEDAARHALRRGGGHLPVGARSGAGAASVRGRRATARLRARDRRRGGEPGGAAGRSAWPVARLQRRQRRAAHDRGDGQCAGQRLRRPAAPSHRRIPARRRPPRRGLARAGRARARLPGTDPVRGRDSAVRPGAAQGAGPRRCAARRLP